MNETVGYLLDTNVINCACDRGITSLKLEGSTVFITHVQRDELENASGDRKIALLDTLETIAPEQMSTSGSVWDVSRWGRSEWPSKDSRLRQFYDEITRLDRESKKKTSEKNRWRDALSLETADRKHLTLVTNDGNLTQCAVQAGIAAICLDEFLKLD